MAENDVGRLTQQMVVELVAGVTAEKTDLIQSAKDRAMWDALSAQVAELKKKGFMVDVPAEWPGREYDDVVEMLYRTPVDQKEQA